MDKTQYTCASPKETNKALKKVYCEELQNTDCTAIPYTMESVKSVHFHAAEKPAHLYFVNIVNSMIELHWLALWCGVNSTSSTWLRMAQSLWHSLVGCLGLRNSLSLCDWTVAVMTVCMVTIVVMDCWVVWCGWIPMVLLSTRNWRKGPCSRSWCWRCSRWMWGYMMRGTCWATKAWASMMARTTVNKDQNTLWPPLIPTFPLDAVLKRV